MFLGSISSYFSDIDAKFFHLNRYVNDCTVDDEVFGSDVIKNIHTYVIQNIMLLTNDLQQSHCL